MGPQCRRDLSGRIRAHRARPAPAPLERAVRSPPSSGRAGPSRLLDRGFVVRRPHRVRGQPGPSGTRSRRPGARGGPPRGGVYLPGGLGPGRSLRPLRQDVEEERQPSVACSHDVPLHTRPSSQVVIRYDYDHYMRVLQARKAEPEKYPKHSHHIYLPNHCLVGKLIFKIDKGTRITDLANGTQIWEKDVPRGEVFFVEKVWAEFSLFYWSVQALMHNATWSSCMPTLGMWHRSREVNKESEMPSWTPDYVLRNTKSFREECWVLGGLEGPGDLSSEPSMYTKVGDYY